MVTSNKPNQAPVEEPKQEPPSAEAKQAEVAKDTQPTATSDSST